MKTNQQPTDFVETKIRNDSGRLITSSQTWIEVADAMNKDVVAISSDETVVSAAKIMADKNVSCIVVEDNRTIYGIVTETDLLKRVVVKAKDFQSTKISEIMSSPIESVSSNLSVLDASEIMNAKSIKRLPVLAAEQLVGIVTQTDLIRVLTSYGMWRDVSMIMSRDALGIQKEATVTEAAKVIAARNTSSVVIMDDNEVVGIFTERDLFKRVIAQDSHPDRTRVGEVMSSPVVSITPDTSVFTASRLMEKMHVRKLVVIEDKQLYGVLSQTDIFVAVKQKLQEEEEKNNKLLELSKSNIYTLLLDGKIT
ncbi:MAG: CBS domain-containing protein, partial [Desulfobacteraceae bacterium]|nr:CBS domain-containing protein [Desulfobacteraceae bacterium]